MGQKTEKATPRRRKEAREKGNVLKSNDVNTAAVLLAMFAGIKVLGGTLANNAMGMLRSYLSHGATSDPLSTGDAAAAIYQAVLLLLTFAAPLLALALLVGIVVNVAQVGFVTSSKALGMKFSRINPLQGFKRIFSVRSVAELLKAVLKVVALGVVAYTEYRTAMGSLPQFLLQDITQSAPLIAQMAIDIAFKMCLVLVALAAADYLYQWWVRERDLKMTKEEIKQEFKQMEGDPQIKNRIRQKQRQMGMQRMMQAIPSANVVITNPTHYAIALRYQEGRDDAPVVIAKGRDIVAQRIKEEARKHGIELVENRSLAQALYVFCEIGDKVPKDMYQAVAEVLATVYRLKHSMSARERATR